MPDAVLRDVDGQFRQVDARKGIKLVILADQDFVAAWGRGLRDPLEMPGPLGMAFYMKTASLTGFEGLSALS